MPLRRCRTIPGCSPVKGAEIPDDSPAVCGAGCALSSGSIASAAAAAHMQGTLAVGPGPRPRTAPPRRAPQAARLDPIEDNSATR
jgi:hypothetical protein